MEWLETGVIGLDKYIKGIPAKKATAVVGSPGTGKTLMALSFAQKCIENDMSVRYIATEERVEDLLSEADAIGQKKLRKALNDNFFINPILDERTQEMDAFYVVEFHKIAKDFVSLIRDIPEETDVVIIDNLGVFTIGMDGAQYRDQIDFLIYKLSKMGMASFIVIDEAINAQLIQITLHSASAAFRLFRAHDPYIGELVRVMDVMKVRNSPTPVNYLMYSITERGLKIEGETKGVQNPAMLSAR